MIPFLCFHTNCLQVSSTSLNWFPQLSLSLFTYSKADLHGGGAFLNFAKSLPPCTTQPSQPTPSLPVAILMPRKQSDSVFNTSEQSFNNSLSLSLWLQSAPEKSLLTFLCRLQPLLNMAEFCPNPHVTLWSPNCRLLHPLVSPGSPSGVLPSHFRCFDYLYLENTSVIYETIFPPNRKTSEKMAGSSSLVLTSFIPSQLLSVAQQTSLNPQMKEHVTERRTYTDIKLPFASQEF